MTPALRFGGLKRRSGFGPVDAIIYQQALSQEKAKAAAAADILDRMANGPAAGADSLVETASGPVKTLHRAIADLEALYAAAPVGESLTQIQVTLAEVRSLLDQVQAEAAQVSGAADQSTHAVGMTLAAQSACEQAVASAASAAQLAGDQAAQARSIMTSLSDLGLDGGDIAEIHALWEEATLLGLDLL